MPGREDAEGAYSPRLFQRSPRLRGEVLASPAVLISCCSITQNGKLFFYASQDHKVPKREISCPPQMVTLSMTVILDSSFVV